MKPVIGQQESNRKYQEKRRRLLGIRTVSDNHERFHPGS